MVIIICLRNSRTLPSPRALPVNSKGPLQPEAWLSSHLPTKRCFLQHWCGTREKQLPPQDRRLACLANSIVLQL